jgi:hypothetical protein
VNNLLIEAAEAPQRSLKARPLPSQEAVYHPWPWLAMLFEVLMFSLSIQAKRRPVLSEAEGKNLCFARFLYSEGEILRFPRKSGHEDKQNRV